jgi:hypothetical protein
MIRLYKLVGEATEEQLDFVNSNLDEKYQNGDYPYLTAEVVDALARKGADIQFVGLLRKALGGDKEVEIMWIDVDNAQEYESLNGN